MWCHTSHFSSSAMLQAFRIADSESKMGGDFVIVITALWEMNTFFGYLLRCRWHICCTHRWNGMGRKNWLNIKKDSIIIILLYVYKFEPIAVREKIKSYVWWRICSSEFSRVHSTEFDGNCGEGTGARAEFIRKHEIHKNALVTRDSSFNEVLSTRNYKLIIFTH